MMHNLHSTRDALSAYPVGVLFPRLQLLVQVDLGIAREHCFTCDTEITPIGQGLMNAASSVDFASISSIALAPSAPGRVVTLHMPV